jgi:hypothetical protein
MNTSYIPSFQAVIRHVESTPEWVVIVSPSDSSCATAFRTVGQGLFPIGTLFTGRTATLPKGGRVSIAETSHHFVPTKKFSVMFLGFEDEKFSSSTDVLVLAGWRQKAQHTITLGSKPGELQFH